MIQRAKEIIEYYCTKNAVHIEDVLGKSRKIPLPDVRAQIIERLRDELDMNWVIIGRTLNMEHSSAIQIYKKRKTGMSRADRVRAYGRFSNFTAKAKFKYVENIDYKLDGE